MLTTFTTERGNCVPDTDVSSHGRLPVPSRTVSTRTPVFIYAADPLSAAGAKAQLMNEPSIELVGPVDLDRARVALVVAEAADESVAKVARAIQRDGVPHVVVIAARFDEGRCRQGRCGRCHWFPARGAEATSARMVELIRQADRAGLSAVAGGFAAAGGQRRAARRQTGQTGGHQPVRTGPRRLGFEAGPQCSTMAEEVRLSARELEVLRLVADGYDTADVAEQLAYSESTIKGVLAKLMTRLEARNRCHAVAIAMREGLI